jgi:hypothetical protein
VWEEQLEAGVKLHPTNILASKDVTVIEGDFENPPDYPFHCPPATSIVCFYRDGRIRGLRQYYAPRPEGQQDYRSAAPGPTVEPQPRRSPMTTRHRSALQHMEGYPFPVLFSTGGARSREARVAVRLERAHRYLRSVLEFDPRIRLLVLPTEDWADHAAFPLYGMPHYTEEGEIIVGDEPADFWQGVTLMLDGVLTRAQRAEAEATYGTVDGRIDMAPFADLLVVHELGHLFHVQVPFAFPRLWLMELFCNLCVRAYVSEEEPQHLPLWTMLPERMMALPPEKVRHRSLNDFERLYVGVGAENYCWYQFRLAVAADEIFDAAGVDALRRLYHTFVAQRKGLTDGQLAKLLEHRVSPVAARIMRAWPR